MHSIVSCFVGLFIMQLLLTVSQGGCNARTESTNILFGSLLFTMLHGFSLSFCHFFWMFRDSLARYWNTRHKNDGLFFFWLVDMSECYVYMCAAILTAEIKLALRYWNLLFLYRSCYFPLIVGCIEFNRQMTNRPTPSWTTRISKEQQQIKSHKTQRTSNE